MGQIPHKIMEIRNLSYLETLSTQTTQVTTGAGVAVSVDASGDAIGELTLVAVDLSANVVSHEQGAVGVGIATVSAHAQDPENATTAAQLEADALARVSRQHSGSYSIDTGAESYSGGYVVSIAID
jgi:hypothetical protein